MGGRVEAHWAAGREPDCLQCGGTNARVALVDGIRKAGSTPPPCPPAPWSRTWRRGFGVSIRAGF